MVWGFSYQPSKDSYPNLKMIEGCKTGPRVIDPTPDGGAKLDGRPQYDAGRRVHTDTVPKIIRWMGNRRLQDYEDACKCNSVSTRLRDLIEEIEPGVHQFEPVKFVNKRGELIEDRWCWIICNRLDSVDRERTTLILKPSPSGISIWRPEGIVNPRTYFSLAAIGDTQFWYDKYLVGPPYISNNAKERLESAKMTGFKFTLAKTTESGA
jgi:hypothetical protein